jgi:cleavage and polyadenylation specificity factor subunit 3
MARLKAALEREYEDDSEYNIEVYNPRNTQNVTLQFRGEKMAKVSIIAMDTSNAIVVI